MTEQEKQQKKIEKQRKKEEKRERKRREEAELDMETTIADMNVEGIRGYDPHRSKNKSKNRGERVSKKEYWAMVGGAYRAILPLLGCILLVALLMFLIGYVWLY